MSYGRTAALQPAGRDQSLRLAGVALVIVGVFEALFGLVLSVTCTAFSSGTCVGREDPAGGLALAVAGVVVLFAGAIVYLAGRRPSRS
jgi:uncharacterized membrane protein YiaA